MSANYNCLINHTSWPTDVPISTESFYQFQLATFSIERTMSKKYSNKYRLQIVCVPVVTTNNTMKYIEGVGKEFPKENNNLRLVLVTRSSADGETGYIEMTPVEARKAGSVVFETEIAVYDNIGSDKMLEIDLNRTPGIQSLISTGMRAGKIFIDAAETRFDFICMMKDFDGKLTTTLYGNDSYRGYMMANRFTNDYRNLTLYKPMSMMRSVITFAGENNAYSVRCSLIPFLKYDIALDDEKMSYFTKAFSEQYNAMEPVLSKLDGNSYLDLKLFNTYGRSSNYYIGPKDGDDVLQNSDILLDNVYLGTRWVLSVWDRSMYNQTVESMINEIQTFVDSLNSGERVDIHSSDLIYTIKDNIPNVKYLRFLGFNDYDANKGSIFVKYTDISELKEDQLQPHVPEMIRVDSASIKITEEV